MSSTILLPHAHSFVIGPAVINTHTGSAVRGVRMGGGRRGRRRRWWWWWRRRRRRKHGGSFAKLHPHSHPPQVCHARAQVVEQVLLMCC